VTGHLEYHITVEMQRTTCLKTETSLCDIQKGELHKVLGKLIHIKPVSPHGFSIREDRPAWDLLKVARKKIL
jgi:hypothetical protein